MHDAFIGDVHPQKGCDEAEVIAVGAHIRGFAHEKDKDCHEQGCATDEEQGCVLPVALCF